MNNIHLPVNTNSECFVHFVEYKNVKAVKREFEKYVQLQFKMCYLRQ